MSDNPARPITRVLLGFLALCLVALDIQHTGLIPRALAALFGGAS